MLIRLGKDEVMKMPMDYFENFSRRRQVRVTEEEVNETLCLINHRPRKCLSWKILFELFHEKVSHLY